MRDTKRHTNNKNNNTINIYHCHTTYHTPLHPSSYSSHTHTHIHTLTCAHKELRHILVVESTRCHWASPPQREMEQAMAAHMYICVSFLPSPCILLAHYRSSSLHLYIVYMYSRCLIEINIIHDRYRYQLRNAIQWHDHAFLKFWSLITSTIAIAIASSGSRIRNLKILIII